MRSAASLCAVGLMALGCSPTVAKVTPITPTDTTTTTGTTGSGSGAMCDACTVDPSCGEAGVAACISESVLPGGHCAPVCTVDADCPAGATAWDELR